jgi:hypothetical protein
MENGRASVDGTRSNRALTIRFAAGNRSGPLSYMGIAKAHDGSRPQTGNVLEQRNRFAPRKYEKRESGACGPLTVRLKHKVSQ